METAYIDFALSTAGQFKDLPCSLFMSFCAKRVSQDKFGMNAEAVARAIACHFMPTYRVFTGKMLISSRIIPTQNASEAFEYIKSLGAMPNELAFIAEDDGTINFAISLNGLKRCAEHCEPVKDMLTHASWILTAYELYAANKQN